jgi:hypothetical protein
MPEGYALKRPCKNCPFQPTTTAITFATRGRAAEISESAYRRGFPCHLSAHDTSDEDEENGGYVFGEKTQHCAGALMMFLASHYDCWPGINNDERLAARIHRNLDWSAPHYASEEDFIAHIGKKEKPRR